MTKVILKGHVIVPENELDAVKAELVTHKRLTKEEPGCLIFNVTESPDNPLRFDVYEEFVDKAAFETHQKRVIASRWGKVAVNVERHYKVFE